MTLATKYRPKSFSEVIGQDHAVVALRNIIKNQKIHNGYIFSGTRGIGKTSLARLFAKALNCHQYDLDNGDVCNNCPSCIDIQNNSHLDLIEIDAASNSKVEEMRELLDSVQFSPSNGKYKIYLIDEVHMLSKNAWNAMLKTLEEPPEHVVFLMATTESDKIPKTIISRCLQFNLKIVSDNSIAENIKNIFKKENISFDDGAIDLLVELAGGSIRDSITLADQAAFQCNNNITEAEMSKFHGLIDKSSVDKLLSDISENNVENIINELKRFYDLDTNYQILFERVLAELHKQIIQEMLKGNDSQDAHLYHQFFNSGFNESQISGRTREAFEISVLKCLSFRDNRKNSTEEIKDDSKKKSEDQSIEYSKKSKSKIPQKSEEKIETEESKQTNEEKKLDPKIWLETFESLDIVGPTRTHFANLEIKGSSDNKVIFIGEKMFAKRIKENNISELKKSLENAGFGNLDIEIEEIDKVIDTPSNNWKKKRKEQIEDFQKEIINSSLIKNLQENYDKTLNKEKLIIIDHEE